MCASYLFGEGPRILTSILRFSTNPKVKKRKCGPGMFFPENVHTFLRDLHAPEQNRSYIATMDVDEVMRWLRSKPTELLRYLWHRSKCLLYRSPTPPTTPPHPHAHHTAPTQKALVVPEEPCEGLFRILFYLL